MSNVTHSLSAARKSPRQPSNTRRTPGFTMVEIMVVIVIMGVLAAVAVPAFIKYIRRAETAEAYDKVSLIYRGAVSYATQAHLQNDRGVSGTNFTPGYPPDDGPTPAVGNCCDVPGGLCIPVATDWDTVTWTTLNFSMADPHRYVYTFEADHPGGVDSVFTARANGDLDCDHVNMSTFERTGIMVSPYEVRAAPGVFTHLPME